MEKDITEMQIEVRNSISRSRLDLNERRQALRQQLPGMSSDEDIEYIESQGFDVRDHFGSVNRDKLRGHNSTMKNVNNTLASYVAGKIGPSPYGMDLTEAIEVCRRSNRFIMGLLLSPPQNIEACGRNPKKEYPQLARILARAGMFDQSVKVLVPCCPDTNQYKLSDGIGEVVPKGLDSSCTLRDLLDKNGFASQFEIQIADVEGLDPVILLNTGETLESHFEKTQETITKTQKEIELRGVGNFVVARSMLDAFLCEGVDYLRAQDEAAGVINATNDKKVMKVVESLLAERVRLRNFVRFDEQTRRELVVAELAGYAAYGKMAKGEIILSPDALSAIPAYHFAVEEPRHYSPVFYAKGEK